MKIVVLTAPSGAGKTTIARRLLARFPGLRFSVSATTRPPRDGEIDGADYFFLSEDAFRDLLAQDAFVEHEEVYPGRFYGTLRSELERTAADAGALLDIDVVGALNVKRMYGAGALTLFIMPPSLATLAERLRARATEPEERIHARLERAKVELEYADRYDAVIMNDDLETAVEETVSHVAAFLEAAPEARL